MLDVRQICTVSSSVAADYHDRCELSFFHMANPKMGLGVQSLGRTL